MKQHLQFLYGADAEALVPRLAALIDRYADKLMGPSGRRDWGRADCLLITYADSIRRGGEPPLQTLTEVLPALVEEITAVHLLPFYPWSSDDGFSVIDPLAVAQSVGTWADVAGLAARFELMFDAVINHVSASSDWFQGFLADDARYRDWFIRVPADADTTEVVRPRTLPLLTPFETARGPELVWTTFSPDQIDLNYAHPDVLLAMLEVLLEYVARGASLLRLDAVTYLWKRLGTSCVHLPETHRVVQLIRSVLDEVAPWVTIITETNVPHDENVSYFGDGHNEAQLVYNFALPPLVLDAFASEDTSFLTAWAAGLTSPSAQTHYLNFLASHDGIGVRGAEAILPPARLEALADRVRDHGGFVGLRTTADGAEVPYELNVNFFDALSCRDEPLDIAVARFLTAHAIMLALPGVPAIYVHSLFGSLGWPEGVALTGANRTINRAKIDANDLLAELAEPSGRRARVLSGLRRLLRVRAASSSFDPNSPARVLAEGPGVFAIERGGGPERVRCLHNVTGVEVPLPTAGRDLLSGVVVSALSPWGTAWLAID